MQIGMIVLPAPYDILDLPEHLRAVRPRDEHAVVPEQERPQGDPREVFQEVAADTSLPFRLALMQDYAGRRSLVPPGGTMMSLRRLLAFVGYSESQGDGDLVYSEATTREWEPIVRDSVDEFLWKFACGKK